MQGAGDRAMNEILCDATHMPVRKAEINNKITQVFCLFVFAPPTALYAKKEEEKSL